MYGAADDVMEAYEILGWVFPLVSSNEVSWMLLDPELGNTEEERKSTLVYHSKRKQQDHFATNVPGLISMLIFWLSKQSDLVSGVYSKDPKSKTGAPFFTSQGNLLPKSEFGKYRSKWFRMTVKHKEYNVIRTIPEALLSLASDGREKGKFVGEKESEHDGISIDNMMKDLARFDIVGHAKLRAEIDAMCNVKPMNFARNILNPTPTDKKNQQKKEDTGTGAASMKILPMLEEKDDYYLAEGQFGFAEREMNKLSFEGQLISDDEIKKRQKQHLDRLISIHSEKLVRLALARAALPWVDKDNSKHTPFGGNYVQTPDMAAGNSAAIANAISTDIATFIVDMFNSSINVARQSGGRRNNLDPLDAVAEIRDGRVPLYHIRTELHHLCKVMLGVADQRLFESAFKEENNWNNVEDEDQKAHNEGVAEFLEKQRVAYLKMCSNQFATAGGIDSDGDEEGERKYTSTYVKLREEYIRSRYAPLVEFTGKLVLGALEQRRALEDARKLALAAGTGDESSPPIDDRKPAAVESVLAAGAGDESSPPIDDRKPAAVESVLESDEVPPEYKMPASQENADEHPPDDDAMTDSSGNPASPTSPPVADSDDESNHVDDSPGVSVRETPKRVAKKRSRFAMESEAAKAENPKPNKKGKGSKGAAKPKTDPKTKKPPRMKKV